ncbi:MAG: DUF1566 domain-containing protein [Flavobacteriales bacterium]|nr:DUF1566 domain-containing protein [Flavobacteriales bacterium]
MLAVVLPGQTYSTRKKDIIEYGAGYQNTESVASLCPENPPTAAAICVDLVLNGYSDWHLPSYDEMARVLSNRNAIGGFNSEAPPICYYWTSSAILGIYSSYIFGGDGGGSGGWNRNNPARVRAVRYF